MRPRKISISSQIIYGILLIFVLYFAMHVAVCFENISEMIETGTIKKSEQIVATLQQMNTRITEMPFTFELSSYTKKFLGWSFFAWIICVLAIENEINRKNYIHGKEFGTSKWGSLKDIKDLFSETILKDEIKKAKKKRCNPKEIESLKEKYKNADMLLTATERISIYNFKVNQNTLVLGGSGSGKTRNFVIPNILQAHSSFIITDPKGEILEKTGYFLTEIKGYKVRVLNLDDKEKSCGYNPFVYIHSQRPGYEERILSLIETIIINTDGGEKKEGNDPFWERAERLFLQSIFFFTIDYFVEKEQNMDTVLSLIEMLKIEDENDKLNSDLDIFAKEVERKLGSEYIGVRQYREFREKASGKTAKSVVISAVARLTPFRTSSVRKILSHDNMLLDRVGEEKTAIFVVVPPTDKTFNFIAGMMFTQLFQELQYCATQVHKHEGQRLKVPCRFLLDEFANTCKIPNFIQILAYARSLGIGITPIVQSLEQIKSMYRNEWGVVLDNCNSILYLGGISHMETLEYISKLLGKGTFDKKTTGRTRGKQGSSSQNFDVIGRELMDAAEIRKLDMDKCLLFVSGRDPFISDKYKYESHPNYGYTSDGDVSLSYELYNANAKIQPSINSVVEIDKISLDLQSKNRLGITNKNFDDFTLVSDEKFMDSNEDLDEIQKELTNIRKKLGGNKND